MNKLRLFLLALVVASVSACGSITGPDPENVGTVGSGGQTVLEQPSYNVGTVGSGG